MIESLLKYKAAGRFPLQIIPNGEILDRIFCEKIIIQYIPFCDKVKMENKTAELATY